VLRVIGVIERIWHHLSGQQICACQWCKQVFGCVWQLKRVACTEHSSCQWRWMRRVIHLLAQAVLRLHYSQVGVVLGSGPGYFKLSLSPNVGDPMTVLSGYRSPHNKGTSQDGPPKHLVQVHQRPSLCFLVATFAFRPGTIR
jgi:hypothetical protein